MFEERITQMNGASKAAPKGEEILQGVFPGLPIFFLDLMW